MADNKLTENQVGEASITSDGNILVTISIPRINAGPTSDGFDNLLQGMLDQANAADRTISSVTIDMKGIQYMDKRAIEFLATIHERLKSDGATNPVIHIKHLKPTMAVILSNALGDAITFNTQSEEEELSFSVTDSPKGTYQDIGTKQPDEQDDIRVEMVAMNQYPDGYAGRLAQFLYEDRTDSVLAEAQRFNSGEIVISFSGAEQLGDGAIDTLVHLQNAAGENNIELRLTNFHSKLSPSLQAAGLINPISQADLPANDAGDSVTAADDSNHLIVTLTGKQDGNGINDLKDLLLGTSQDGGERGEDGVINGQRESGVVIDLSHFDELNDATIDVLLNANRRAAAHNIPLIFASANNDTENMGMGKNTAQTLQNAAKAQGQSVRIYKGTCLKASEALAEPQTPGSGGVSVDSIDEQKPQQSMSY